MASFVTKRNIFMGCRLILAGVPVDEKEIHKGFLKHFEGFGDDCKPCKEEEKSAEDQQKQAIEDEGKKYGVDLDKRKSIKNMKADLVKAKASAKIAEEAKASAAASFAS